MKLIIDIPEEMYNRFKQDLYTVADEVDVHRIIIPHGTPLPKGHGDLIDRQELINGLEFVIDNGQINFHGKHGITAEGYLDILKGRPIIIPADKEGEE